MKKLFMISVAAMLLSACASVPMAPLEKSYELKQFKAPPQEQSGIYIYRPNTIVGAALKKDIYIDNQFIGESAKGTFFYKAVTPGQHTVSTESEFGQNHLPLTTQGGQNYFVRQYIKMGVFVGGAGLELVNEARAKAEMADVNLAQ